jgi:hypothetical protein
VTTIDNVQLKDIGGDLWKKTERKNENDWKYWSDVANNERDMHCIEWLNR